MDLNVEEKVWIEFMESPIAALEDYGVDPRIMQSCEENGVIYIKQLQCMTVDDIMQYENFGETMCRKLVAALALYLEHLSEN